MSDKTHSYIAYNLQRWSEGEILLQRTTMGRDLCVMMDEYQGEIEADI